MHTIFCSYLGMTAQASALFTVLAAPLPTPTPTPGGGLTVRDMRVVAGFVDKVLKGARPADLPVHQPTQFEFVVNLATAERIRITIPESVLRRATEVVR